MAKRSNGEGSFDKVVKKGITYYRLRITLGYDPITGKQKRKEFYGKTLKEAKEKLSNFERNNNTNSDDSTLGGFYYNWLWNVKKQLIKSSTFEKWEGIYRNYIKPNPGLNNKKIIEIDTMYLQKITNKLLEDHTVSQLKTLNGCLNNCFKYAISINKISVNPTKGIVYPKDYNVSDEKPNYITEEEQKRLINALKGDKLEGIILMGLLCGVRLGEAMALTEDDINFDNNTININKSVKYAWTGERTKEGKKIHEFEVTTPKTKNSIREVPLPNKLVPILKNIILKNKENKLKYGSLYFNNKLLFCKDTGIYIDSKQPTRRLKSALKKTNITADLHYHSLRHIFITNCISKDIPIKTVMDWVGHADIKTTMLIYAEVNKDKNKKEYEKINSMFE